MKRITHGLLYIELTDRLCELLWEAHIINKCTDGSHQHLHHYHPAFAEHWSDTRDERKIWTALVQIAEDYGEGIHNCEDDPKEEE